MSRSHEVILEALRNGEKITGRELAEKTGLSYDGIRGRISELQTKGYAIKKDGKKYYMDKMVKYTPFVIKKDKTGIILTLPINSDTSNVSIEDASLFEKSSKEFMKNLKSLLIKIKNNKKKKDKMRDILLNWDIGDAIEKYIVEMNTNGFHISNNSLFKTLEQYVIGGNRYRYQYWIDRVKFRQLYSKDHTFLPIGYNMYNEIRVCKTSKQREQLEKFIKDRLKTTGKTPTVTEIRNERWRIGGTKKGSSKAVNNENSFSRAKI